MRSGWVACFPLRHGARSNACHGVGAGLPVSLLLSTWSSLTRELVCVRVRWRLCMSRAQCDAFFAGQCALRQRRKTERRHFKGRGEDVYVFAGVYMRNSEAVVGREVDRVLDALPDRWSPR